MTAVLLSAGKATRLGDLAPHGCKALVKVGPLTMVDWWSSRFEDDFLVVCRSEHVDHLPAVPHVVFDGGRGAASALRAALPYCDEGPVTVIYADTWVAETPDGDEWCAVGAANGGRNWDVIEDGIAAYRWVDEEEIALVAVGLYRFGAKWKLAKALAHEIDMRIEGEVGLADVVNDLNLPLVPAFAWQDVGDPDALNRWRTP